MTWKQARILALLLAPLSGCGGGEPPAPAYFPPLHYEYLNKIRLNVGAIDVQDHSTALGANDIAAQSAAPLGQAAEQMAHDRLFPGGLTGHADFVIDQASIIQGPGGVLDGLLAVHLSLYDVNGNQEGFAQARITNEYTPGSEPENLRVLLYNMSKKIMDDMNVELEYQIRHSLSQFLVTGEPLPAPVTAAPLDAPAGSPMGSPLPPPPPQPTIPGATLEPAPYDPNAAPPPPPQMSPPPGFLTLPPGTPH